VVLALAVGGLAGEAAAQARRKIYLADYPNIRRANLDGSGVENLLFLDAADIALDVAGGKMYLTTYSKIQRANLDGTGLQDLITTGLRYPYGLALDVAGGKMYWNDPGTGKIQRANLDGTGVQDLISTGQDDSVGIALDVAGGKMYWTVYRGPHRIQRANLDGTGVQDLVITGGPIRIALDVAGGKMYWTDSDYPRIERANLDGYGVQELTSAVYQPRGIALDVAGGKMYWLDAGTDRLMRANLDGSSIQDLGTTGINPWGLALDLTVGGFAQGFQPTKVVCKNVTTGQRVNTKSAPGALFWDCAGAGLAVKPGDKLSIAPVGPALGQTTGGVAHGFQPAKVVCKNITTGKKAKIILAPNALSWDCAAAGLVVQPGDSLKMTLTGTEP
jgi:hypothetical protein